jgi:hypothetical protein
VALQMQKPALGGFWVRARDIFAVDYITILERTRLKQGLRVIACQSERRRMNVIYAGIGNLEANANSYC